MDLKKVLTMGVVLGSLSSALMAGDVKVGGNYLGVIHAIDQKNESGLGSRTHFDYAANVDFEYKVSDTITGVAQLQTSPGSGAMGFPGPGAALTDVNITIACPEHKSTITLGSFDTPFGQQTPYLTNNANGFGNALLSNSLLYSALAGPVGTLNTLGAMVDHNAGFGHVILGVTNGTDESATNPNGGLETVVSVTQETWLPNTSLGFSYLTVNDSDGSGFGAHLNAWILDAHFNLNSDIHVKTYVSTLDYSDGMSATEDKVTAWSVEVKKMMSKKFFIAARVSQWNPEDNDGSGAGMSSKIVNPGFGMTVGSVTPVLDQTISRYQVGTGYYLEENVLLKSEFFMDDYAKETSSQNTDVYGVLATINVAF